MTDRPNTEMLALLRQAGVERDAMGRRLSRYEFQALRDELRLPDVFGFNADLGEALGQVRWPAKANISRLPALPVPLGRIAWAKRAEDLPVVGILVEELPDAALAEALLALLTEHHRAPFARLLFLCRTLRPVHVLARYGLLCEAVGHAPLPVVAASLALRYQVGEVRALTDGKRLWRT
ncbi:hypothetical protein [Tropicibacter naphthalenivorans]|uniref:Uncharacterized protein n=1 Tax=Tropicibacter naphthalenivorans TaxID=441103 RepID=A0A0P1GKU3_9RHOB|nr:hypothetical protein [Tropicibacter naphthalenivorans]CUH82686.1 hypothetical protein TRN7648_04229 [Tropicibacter naphthalenivorans]SMD11170.1 hypothetical protein SAMN04488093_12510 [Tropicibacter naphthalenivorans]